MSPDATKVERICRNCDYWKKDYGIFTATGWTGMNRDSGWCLYECGQIPKSGVSRCHHWEAKRS